MRKLCLFTTLVLAAVSSAPAQLVSVGALGGVRLTDGFDFGDDSRIYDVGGSVEFRLPAGFALEADTLYQRVGYSYGPSSVLSIASGLISINNGVLTAGNAFRERANLWEFPLLGKYYFRSRDAAWQPFLGTGFAFRTGSLHSDTTDFSTTPFTLFHGDSRFNVQTGAEVAAGIRFRLGPINLLPQARYTYWGQSTQRLSKNEATLLLGVSF
jgi:Outer membrane protein beta-barrel domain